MTVGLCIITKEFDSELYAKLAEYIGDGEDGDVSKNFKQFFDKIYVQVNGSKEAYKKAKDTWEFNNDIFEVSYFKWNDNFADARNALLQEVATDYWCWLDSDDIIQHPENIRQVIEHMEASGTEITFADYIYAQSEGIPTEVQKRERFIKTGTPGKWVGAVHETWIPDGSVNMENTDLVTWVHHNPNPAASAARNERILKSEADKGDPRIYYYLGLCLATQGKLEEAIPWFEKLIEEGGWDEERYRAWLQLASCYQQLQRYDEAANAYLNATQELPDWPDAYYGLQQVYYELDDHQKSISWFETGQSKRRPETDSAYNPVVIEYQPLLLAGLSYLFIGQVTNALKAAGTLKRIAPNFGELRKLEPEIIRAYNEEQAIEAAKTLIKYNAKYDGDPKAVLDALPPTLRADIRLTNERRTLIPGKVWPKGSIVFYCGQSYEPWGPDTLGKGMGGSEEAVVYLARELQAQGQRVTVYNERSTPYFDETQNGTHFAGPSTSGDPLYGGESHRITYLPWTEINPNDKFDTFIAERDPTVLKDIKARVKLCDLHDTIDPQVVYNNAQFLDKYIFRSEWHRNLYPELDDDKAVVVGNGILMEYK